MDSPLHLYRPQPFPSFPPLSPLRRYYNNHDHHNHQPKPFRSIAASNIAVGGVIATCTSLYAYSVYADSLKDPREREKHMTWIKRNLMHSRRNEKEGRWWTIFTYTFMHGSFQHLAFNMIAFSSFARAAIMKFGLPSVAFIWAGAGMVAAFAGLTLQNDSKVMDGQDPADFSHVGASGSILGIMAAVTCSYPRSRMWIFPIVSSPSAVHYIMKKCAESWLI